MVSTKNKAKAPAKSPAAKPVPSLAITDDEEVPATESARFLKSREPSVVKAKGVTSKRMPLDQVREIAERCNTVGLGSRVSIVGECRQTRTAQLRVNLTRANYREGMFERYQGIVNAVVSV